MLFNLHTCRINALLHRAFLFSIFSISTTLHADAHNEVYLSNPDLKSLAASTQLLVASNTGLRAENIVVQVYRGYPDMTQVAAVNRHYQSGAALPTYAADSFLSFVFSKPAIANDTVTIHALYVLNEQGVPANEVWLKLKSPPSLEKNIHKNADKTTVTGDIEKEINVQQLQQAVFNQLNISATPFDATAVLIQQGPVWLDTAITRSFNNGKITLQLPIVATPLDVSERFAGHFYIKLLTDIDRAN